MVVDDEKDILLTLKDFFESEGYNVLTAENGLEAMQLLEKFAPPDLILLDMKMPVMNGWEFANKFRDKHDHLSPVVVITAAADAEQRAKDINADGWIEKPFNLDDLLKKIKQIEKKAQAEHPDLMF